PILTMTTLTTFQLHKRLRLRWSALILVALLAIMLLKLIAPTNAQSENPLPPLSDNVISNIKTIAMIGQARNNNLYVFAKVGDSITVGQRFLYPIGDGKYQLGDHTYLQPVIDAFLQTPVRNGNSFNNPSVASAVGWASYNVLTPRNADPYQREAGES